MPSQAVLSVHTVPNLYNIPGMLAEGITAVQNLLLFLCLGPVLRGAWGGRCTTRGKSQNPTESEHGDGEQRVSGNPLRCVGFGFGCWRNKTVPRAGRAPGTRGARVG